MRAFMHCPSRATALLHSLNLGYAVGWPHASVETFGSSKAIELVLSVFLSVRGNLAPLYRAQRECVRLSIWGMTRG